MNLFQRAAAYQQLSPSQRALLKLTEGLCAVALVAASPIIADALSAHAANWSDIAREAMAAAVVAVLLALVKWAKAHGDPALAAVAGSIVPSISVPNVPVPVPQSSASVPAQGMGVPTPSIVDTVSQQMLAAFEDALAKSA